MNEHQTSYNIIVRLSSLNRWPMVIDYVSPSLYVSFNYHIRRSFSMFYWFWHIFDLTHMPIYKMTFGLVHAQHVNECLMSNDNILVLLFCISILSLNFIINKNNDDVMTRFSIDQSDIKVVSCYMRIQYLYWQ
jgi:L-asparagine transporter-like permease